MNATSKELKRAAKDFERTLSKDCVELFGVEQKIWDEFSKRFFRWLNQNESKYNLGEKKRAPTIEESIDLYRLGRISKRDLLVRIHSEQTRIGYP